MLAAALPLGLASACRARVPAPTRPLRLVFAARPQALDPQRHRDETTRAVLANFYEPLIERGPSLELRPRLALEWSNPEPRVWRLRLRGGVRFHDGSPFGALDVKRTLARARALRESRADADVRGVVEVRTPDDLTVELVTDRPRPLLAHRLAQLPILPRSAGDEAIRQPVGTGPYRFEKSLSRPDLKVVGGTRFDSYWGEAPAFPAFLLEVVPEDPRRLAAAQRGADLVSPLPPEALDAKGRPQGSFRALRHPTLTVAYLACRLGRLSGGAPSPFAQAPVRRALDLALDRDALVRGREREAVAADQLVPRGVAGFLEGRPRPALQRDLARQLLRESGYASGFDTTLVTPLRARGPAVDVARQLAEVGIRVQVEPVAPRELAARAVTGQAPLALLSWTADTGDAAGVFEAGLHSRRGAGGLGADNPTGYASAAVDAALLRASTEMRPDVRLEALRAVMRQALDDRPLIPLFTPLWTYGVGADVDFAPRLDAMAVAADVKPIR